MSMARRSARKPRTMTAKVPLISSRQTLHEDLCCPASSGQTPAESHVENVASRLDHAVMQPGDGVERRQNGALLPCRNVGCMLTRQHDSAVDLASMHVGLPPS